jgi:2-C-methyl-D-erythritol 4-phosphate cytidylyltransferase
LKVTAIIPAAGSGKRLSESMSSGDVKKQFLHISGKPMLSRTVSVFESCQSIDDIIVVVAKEDIDVTGNILAGYKKVKKIIAGGAERQDSVYNGLREVSADTDIVVIHDGARPLVTKEIIATAVTEAKTSRAVVVGVPSKDTIKNVTDDHMVQDTLDRSRIWLVQTPQVFELKLIKEAYERAKKVGYSATDDSKLVERLGIPVKMVFGSYENIKVTGKEDIILAEAIITGRGE